MDFVLLPLLHLHVQLPQSCLEGLHESQPSFVDVTLLHFFLRKQGHIEQPFARRTTLDGRPGTAMQSRNRRETLSKGRGDSVCVKQIR